MGSTISEVRCDLCGNDNCIEELYYKTVMIKKKLQKLQYLGF